MARRILLVPRRFSSFYKKLRSDVLFFQVSEIEGKSNNWFSCDVLLIDHEIEGKSIFSRACHESSTISSLVCIQCLSFPIYGVFWLQHYRQRHLAIGTKIMRR